MILLDILIATLVLFPLPADEIWFALVQSNIKDASLEPSDLRIPLAAAAVIAAMVVQVRRRGSGRLLADAGSKLLWLAGALAAMLALVAFLSFHLGVDAGVAVARLTYGTGAIPLVAIVAVLVRRWSSEPWEASFFVRLGARIARAWLGALERAPGRTLWGAAAVVGAFFFWVALVRHRAFDSHGFDLGIFTNAIWNLTHGNGYVSSVKEGINLFSDHQSPLFWALAPLFALVPRPETLLFAQAFGLAAGGPALYYLARSRFGAHWIGAAPRYAGNSEPWMLRQPSRGTSRIACGRSKP